MASLRSAHPTKKQGMTLRVLRPSFAAFAFKCSPLRLRREHAAADLVALDRFEQRPEIALAEAFIALALDDLEEDRADHGLGEDLQEQPLTLARRAVDQDLVALEAGTVLA